METEDSSLRDSGQTPTAGSMSDWSLLLSLLGKPSPAKILETPGILPTDCLDLVGVLLSACLLRSIFSCIPLGLITWGRDTSTSGGRSILVIISAELERDNPRPFTISLGLFMKENCVPTHHPHGNRREEKGLGLGRKNWVKPIKKTHGMKCFSTDTVLPIMSFKSMPTQRILGKHGSFSRNSFT